MASSSGAKRANQRGKDQERAADLKARGVVRTTQRCPVCNRLIGNAGFGQHLQGGCRGNG